MKSKLLHSLALCLALGATTLPAAAADSPPDPPAATGADLTSVRAKIEKTEYKAALEELRGLEKDHGKDASVLNLIGFTLRKTGDYPNALTYYTKALELDPGHKGAHEYLGELYLETDKPEKAKEQLAELVKLCPDGCEEKEDLEKAIAAKAPK